MVPQTTTPIHLLLGPSKEALRSEFVGKPLDGIRTPALVIDRSLFAQNCTSMHQRAAEWGATFRAHLKTHKVGVGCCVSAPLHVVMVLDCRGVQATASFWQGPFTCCGRINAVGSLVRGQLWFS